MPTKFHLVKTTIFPVGMYGCDSWIIKKAEHQIIDTFELWCWRRSLRGPWTARRFNQSILKEIITEYSMEGRMLTLKCQYFGHLIWRADSFEKTLMSGKTEIGRRRGEQRTEEDRWLDGITDSKDLNLSKPRKLVMDREAWHAAVHVVTKSQTRLSNSSELNEGMLTIHQARLQQHINLEIAVVPTGVRKDRNQRSNWQHPLDHGKSKIFLSIYLSISIYRYRYIDIYSASLTMIKVHCVDHNKRQKIFKDFEISEYLPASWETCIQVKKQQWEKRYRRTDGLKLENKQANTNSKKEPTILSPCLFNIYRAHLGKCCAGGNTSWI